MNQPENYGERGDCLIRDRSDSSLSSLGEKVPTESDEQSIPSLLGECPFTANESSVKYDISGNATNFNGDSKIGEVETSMFCLVVNLNGGFNRNELKQSVAAKSLFKIGDSGHILQVFGYLLSNQGEITKLLLEPPQMALSKYITMHNCTLLERRQFCIELGSGLVFLEQQGILHPDLTNKRLFFAEDRLKIALTGYTGSPMFRTAENDFFLDQSSKLDQQAVTYAYGGCITWLFTTSGDLSNFDGLHLSPYYATLVQECRSLTRNQRPEKSDIVNRL